MASYSESVIQEEIEVLQSIYLPEELEIRSSDDRPNEILVMLHPYTAENEDGKYVCMQLVIKLDNKYPNIKPSFEFKMPRGISDAQLDSIKVNLEGLASHRLGEAMLFELIEYAKECLTSNNKPECTCAICLEYFDEEDNFTRTECYHFFHDVCLARYVKSYLESCEIKVIGSSSPFEEQPAVNKDVIPCPICRTGINRDLLEKGDVDISSFRSEEVVFEPSTKFLAWRKRMKAIYLRQQKRGGIIDVEAEKNKYLIETKTVDDEESLESIDEPRLLAKEGIHILGDRGSWISESRIVEQSLLAASVNSNRTNAGQASEDKKSYTDSTSRPMNNIVPKTRPGGRARSPVISKTRTTETNVNSSRMSMRDPIKSKKPSEDAAVRPTDDNESARESRERAHLPMSSEGRLTETSASPSRTDNSISRRTNNKPRTEPGGRAISPIPLTTRVADTQREREHTGCSQPRKNKENSSPSPGERVESKKPDDDSACRSANNNEPSTESGGRAPSPSALKTRTNDSRRDRKHTGYRQPRRTKENTSSSSRESIKSKKLSDNLANNNDPRAESDGKAPSPLDSMTSTNDSRREREHTGYRQSRRTKENSSPSSRERVECADSSGVSNRRAGQFTEKSTASDRKTVSGKNRIVSTTDRENSKAETKVPVRPPPGFKPLS